MNKRELNDALRLLEPFRDPRKLLLAMRFTASIEYAQEIDPDEADYEIPLVAATFKGFCTKQKEYSLNRDIEVILLPFIVGDKTNVHVWAPPPRRKARGMSHVVFLADLIKDYFINVRQAEEEDWAWSVNETLPFWKHDYLVQMNAHDSGVVVNANSECDALDDAADYHDEQGNEGFFLTEEEEAEAEREGYPFTNAGNFCRPVPTEHLHITHLK
jgi:hypothetical protein